MGRELGISFRILGPIEIGVDGRRIALPGGHARSILGLLLLQPNRVVSTDHLIEALWRDEPPRTAQNVLQAHVVTLRRALRAGDGDGAALVTRLETFRGSHVGPFLGVEGTGRLVHVTGMDIFRFEGDQIAEFWTEFNLMNLAEQIGAIATATAA